MRTLYIDCGMGAAGDMLTAALWELIPNREEFVHRMNTLGLPGIAVTAEKSVKCGITGTHFRVKVHGEEESELMQDHHHGSMEDIRSIVSSLPIPTMVKLDIMTVYNKLAEAESHVHGVPVNQIHFHEIGTMDAIADITAVCLLMHELKADKVIASPVHVGSGSVRCAHGILPVPAPATAYILRNIPIYGGRIQGELCTPTGAALLKHFVDDFGEMPTMTVKGIGYGMGKKNFDRANCIRVMLGETTDKSDSIVELSCNIDDMTGEMIGFALEHFMKQGALDVFTVPIGMKKSRPGILLTVLCREEDKERFIHLIFKHTTTLGIREKNCNRYTLERRTETVDTPLGQIRQKISSGYGIRRSKFEYDDIAKAAINKDLSITEALDEISLKF